MIRVITYGLIAQYNLGCPSILHGVYELLKELYQDDFEMINLQYGEILPEAVSDMKFPSQSVEQYRAKQFLQCYFFHKKQTSQSGLSLSEVREMIQHADVVINLFGICFCEKLGAVQRNRLMVPLYALLQYPYSAFARRYHKRSLKTAASFGPAQGKYTRALARWCCTHLFDCVQAREAKSREFLCSCGVHPDKIIDAPDIANLMPVDRSVTFPRKTVGISVSHQIIRQWTSPEGYVECITMLIRHIVKAYQADVLLIPNEYLPEVSYNDIHVATECMENLESEDLPVSVLDVCHMTSTELKSHIAACDAIVASRYHSCVAALSAGVPLLTVGWHYKYEELLHWYGQDPWMLSQEDCSSEKLIAMFDRFWEQKEKCRAEIKANGEKVCRAVIDAGKKMLGVDRQK